MTVISSSLLVAWALLQGSTPVPIRTIDKGQESAIDSARQVTVAGPEEWEKLWHEHAPNRPVPQVDFSRDIVVGVFLGTRPTAGFGVEITAAREEGAGIVVQYRENRPPPGAIAAQILTAPYHLVVIPKHSEVRFESIR